MFNPSQFPEAQLEYRKLHDSLDVVVETLEEAQSDVEFYLEEAREALEEIRDIDSLTPEEEFDTAEKAIEDTLSDLASSLNEDIEAVSQIWKGLTDLSLEEARKSQASHTTKNTRSHRRLAVHIKEAIEDTINIEVPIKDTGKGIALGLPDDTTMFVAKNAVNKSKDVCEIVTMKKGEQPQVFEADLPSITSLNKEEVCEEALWSVDGSVGGLFLQ